MSTPTQARTRTHTHTHRCALPLTEAPGLIVAAVAALVEVEGTGVIVDVTVSAVGVLSLQIVDDIKCSTQHDNVRVIVGQPKHPEGQDVPPFSDPRTPNASP